MMSTQARTEATQLETARVLQNVNSRLETFDARFGTVETRLNTIETNQRDLRLNWIQQHDNWYTSDPTLDAEMEDAVDTETAHDDGGDAGAPEDDQQEGEPAKTSTDTDDVLNQFFC